MQITLTVDDITTAPNEVREWISCRMFGNVPALQEQVDKADSGQAESQNGKEEPTTKVEVTSAETKPESPSLGEVMDKAIALMKDKGEEELAEVLKKLGIRRVKECPESKLADLLTEIAIRA